MTDELQIDGVTVAEKDGSGNLVIKNVQSLTTEDATIKEIESPIAAGSFDLWQFADEGNGTIATTGVRSTDSVSTTAKEIYSADDAGLSQDMRSNLVHVHGRDPSSGSNHFTDIVLFLPFGGVTTIGSLSRGSTPSRSYSENSRALELSLSSGTFDVIVSVDGLNTT